MQQLIDELKRRRVFRVATLYIVSFWPIIQIVDILSPALELPDSVMRYLVIAFAAGFPLALILAWIFDVNKDGVSVTDADAGASEAGPLIGNRSEFAVIGILLALVAILFLVQLSAEPDADPATTEQIANIQAPPPVAPSETSKSVAVLPFVAFSEDIADQQFADGLTEELLNVLARVKQLRVAARTSTFAYRGVNKNITQIGRELRVGTILEGSVRRNDVDDTVRITAQLIDARTGSHLWSKTYDRQFSDVFAIQDDIASSVVDELQITLLGDERKKIMARRTVNPEAMAAYGIAKSELARRSEQSLSDAIRFFERAISLDPGDVDSQVGIATAHALNVSYGYATDYKTALEKAQRALDKAFAMDPESGSAWATQGLIHMQWADHDSAHQAKAVEALEKAIEYNPSHAPAVMWYAGQQTDKAEKLKWYRKAYELDPRSPVIGYNIANLLFFEGREAEAMKIYSQMIEADPHYHSAYNLAGQMAESRGRIDEAINQYTRAYELSGSDQYAMSLTRLYTDLGDFDKTQEWLAEIDNHGHPGYQGWINWLKIAAFAATDQMDKARPMLQDKVRLADEAGDNPKYADASLAAYFLGDDDAVIRNFEKITGETTAEHFNNSNRIDAMVAAARVYQERGQDEKAAPLVAHLESLLADQSQGTRQHFSYWGWMSRLYLLKGEERMALMYLQRAIDEGFRSHWMINLDPTFAPLRENPAFSGMIAGLETRMSIMRDQLAIASAFDSDWSG